jgi:hypothetical protein
MHHTPKHLSLQSNIIAVFNHFRWSKTNLPFVMPVGFRLKSQGVEFFNCAYAGLRNLSKDPSTYTLHDLGRKVRDKGMAFMAEQYAQRGLTMHRR